MKAITKSNGSRLQRAARSSAPARRKSGWIDPFEDETADTRWDALDESIDLDTLGFDDDDADTGSGDWLADQDLAMEIAQRALH